MADALAPTAEGTFAKTPFPHLLVYALERSLSGTFELRVGADSVATMLVLQGFPAKLRTTEGVHFLGEVMEDLGLVTSEALAASLERLQESPRLQGQILIELGAADEAGVEAGVRAQLERKLQHLFALPDEATFAYYDGVDALQRYGGAPTPIDPLPALWRGVRHTPAWEHVDATLKRVGRMGLRLIANAQLDRFRLTPLELQAVDLLRQRPLRIAELASAKVIAPSIAQLLVYLLVITKQVDLIETPSIVPTAMETAPMPQVAPMMPVPAALAAPPGPPAPPAPAGAPPASGQAFARVQLQAKSVQRAPLIVEEAPVTRSSADGRISSPLPRALPHVEESDTAGNANVLSPIIPPQAAPPVIIGMPPLEAPAPPASSSVDIGAMITTTIASSRPPPMASPDSPLAVDPPSAARPPSSDRLVAAPLSGEQRGLKQKILQRAHEISSQDYFQMLGLERDAAPETVQKAFFALAKVWHPDRLPAALLDVKDACSKVFTHLTEAQATLCDAERRAEYMTLLKDGGATPDDQAKIHAVLEAAMEFQKAEIVMKRNDLTMAYNLAKKAHTLDPEQADYLALVTWLEAQRPEWVGRDKTLEKIAVLDGCIKLNPNSERAYFWRGLLYKRVGDTNSAIRDFKRAGELNPRNLDAVREVRLFNLRAGAAAAPGGGAPGGRPSQRPPAPEKIGSLFGKLFKK